MTSPGHSRPAVSVVIPCFKQAGYLAESVGSLLAQTFRDWECVVVDDGSPDDTADVVRALAARHPERSIRLVQQRNQGLGAARNSGIRASMGRYILPLDADDLLAPEMLERCVALLDSRREIAIVFTDVQLFGVQAHRWNTGPFTLDAELEENRIPYCSLYRREVWDAVGGYDPTKRLSHEDWEFWLHALRRGYRGERIAEPLFRYRTAARSMVTDCNAQRPKMLGILALNHPGLFGEAREAQARALLGAEAKPVLREPWAPAHSVIATTRGRAGELQGALESVLAQGIADLEVLVVNDGGAPVDALLESIDPGGRIQSLRTSRRRGRAAARNLGLRAARGRTVSYLDEEERYLPGALASLLEALADGAAQVAYGDALVRGASTSEPAPRLRSGPFDPDALLFAPQLPLAGLVHLRSCSEEAGGFDESLGALDDWEFTLRLGQRHSHRHLPRAVCAVPAPAPDDASLKRHSADIIRHKHRALLPAAGERLAAKRLEAARSYRAKLPSIESMLASGDPSAALAALEQFTDATGGCAEAHNDLAAVLHSVGRSREALPEAQRAALLEPESTPICCTLAILQLALGDVRGAARTLGPALHRAPADAALRAVAAEIERASRRPPPARPRDELLVLAFSRDRQLQLDATLRSLELHWRDPGRAQLKVLTKATTPRHRALYGTLAGEHPRVELIEERDFREQLLALLGRFEQVLFLVDDNLVVRPFELREASRALREDPALLGVSLRLGRNTTHCYTLRADQRLPEMSPAFGMQRFRWVSAEHDFGYPLEVSSSLYRAPEMLALLSQLPFRNPNQLEAMMAAQAPSFAAAQPDLLCFEQSVTFCNPVNIVQTTFVNNRAGQASDESPEALAARYAAGERVDVEAYRGLVPTGCHQEVKLEFTRTAGAEPEPLPRAFELVAS